MESPFLDQGTLAEPCRVSTVVITAGPTMVIHVLGDAIQQTPAGKPSPGRDPGPWFPARFWRVPRACAHLSGPLPFPAQSHRLPPDPDKTPEPHGAERPCSGWISMRCMGTELAPVRSTGTTVLQERRSGPTFSTLLKMIRLFWNGRERMNVRLAQVSCHDHVL